MSIDIGSVYEGKVTGITKFGAFVQLPEGKSGMVHISEVANTYVEDISTHLQEGMSVKVRVIGIDQMNRINLSIKKAEDNPNPPQPRRENRPPQDRAPQQQQNQRPDRFQQRQSTIQKTDDDSFEGKLKAFMQSSESRMSDIKSQREGRGGGKRRK